MIGSDDLSLAARLGPVVRGAVEVFLARHSRDVATIDVEDAYREAMTRILDAAQMRPISDPFVRAIAREEALKRHGTRPDAFDDLTGRSSDADERREEAAKLGTRRAALESDAQLLLALALDDALEHDVVATCVGGEPNAVVKAISRARRAARSADAPSDEGDRPIAHVGAPEIAARIEGQVIATDDRINGHLARCADCRAALREVALVPTHESPPPQDPDEQFGAGPSVVIAPPPLFDPGRDDDRPAERMSPGAIVALLVVLGLMGTGVWYAFRTETVETKYAAIKFEGEFRRDGEVGTPTEGMELKAGDSFRTTRSLVLTTHPAMRYGVSTETSGYVTVHAGARFRIIRADDGALGIELAAGDLSGSTPTVFRVRTTSATIHLLGSPWQVGRFPEATANELSKQRWATDDERLHGRDVTLVRHSRESNTVVIESALAGAIPVSAGDVMAIIDSELPRSLLR